MNFGDLLNEPGYIANFLTSLVFTYIFYSALCLMLLFSFGKFYRRYTEEALFSFVLCREDMARSVG